MYILIKCNFPSVLFTDFSIQGQDTVPWDPHISLCDLLDADAAGAPGGDQGGHGLSCTAY